jgi:hypothetical protein
MRYIKRHVLDIIGCAILITAFLPSSAPQTSSAQTWFVAPTTQGNSRTFPETGQTIAGDFLKYWNEHGALAQQGYPISPEMQELSEIDGKSYTVQYFERAKFEKHPEQSNPQNQVLLELFGVLEYRDRYPEAAYPQGAPGQVADTTPGSVLFELTGKRLGSTFLQYWKTHGDVRQQGYPISDMFEEVAEDGKTYKVQYFERAKFELHTEFAGTTNEVLLSRTGAKFLEKRYVKGGDGSFTPKPKGTPIVQPSPTKSTVEVTPTANPNIVEYDLSGFKLKIDNSPSLNDHGLEVLNSGELGIMVNGIDYNHKGSISIKLITIPDQNYKYTHGQITEYGTKVIENIIGSIKLQVFYGENDKTAIIHLTKANFDRIIQLQDTSQEGSLGANWIVRDSILQAIAGSGKEVMDTEPFKRKASEDPAIVAVYNNRQTKLIP